MNYSEYKYLVLSDLYRITGKVEKTWSLIYQVFFGQCFSYIFWMRTYRFVSTRWYLRFIIGPIATFMLRRLSYKLGISIPVSTEIGSGFYIGHFGGIVINQNCELGNNCNIMHGVTIGQANRGKYKGYSTVGDNVFIGPGAKVIGSVTIGNNVVIGANCVVTKDVADNSVVVGIPGRVISDKGARDYINKTDYDKELSCCQR